MKIIKKNYELFWVRSGEIKPEVNNVIWEGF